MTIQLINKRDGRIHCAWQQSNYDSDLVFKSNIIEDIDSRLELFGYKPLSCSLNDFQCELLHCGMQPFKNKSEIPLYFWNLYLSQYKIEVREIK